jgi:hypothetical protein
LSGLLIFLGMNHERETANDYGTYVLWKKRSVT